MVCLLGGKLFDDVSLSVTGLSIRLCTDVLALIGYWWVFFLCGGGSTTTNDSRSNNRTTTPSGGETCVCEGALGHLFADLRMVSPGQLHF